MKLYAVIITEHSEYEDYASGYDSDEEYFDSDDMLTLEFDSDSIYGIFDSEAKAQQAKIKFEDENQDDDCYVTIVKYTLNEIVKDEEK